MPERCTSLARSASSVLDAEKEILSKELNVQAYRYGYSAGRIPESLKEFEEIQEERRRLESFGKRPNFLLFDADFARAKDQELSQLMRRPDEEVKDLVREAVEKAWRGVGASRKVSEE